MPATTTKTPPVKGPAEERFPGAAAWSRAMRDLPDLPYKVETNARGQLILSPPKPEHGFSQLSIGKAINIDVPGQAATEFSVHTSDGIKVPDVIWISAERRAQIPEGAEASPVMPELCVEVLSDANTEEEMKEKRQLYFEGGAQEVWLVSRATGKTTRVHFFGPGGQIEQSKLAPDFPEKMQT